jgi:hypothetical protein
MALIDGVMPAYDRREVHRRRVGAPPAAVWRAVREVETGELKLASALMSMRSLGRGGFRPGPVLRTFERMGFAILGEEPGRELLIGGIGRFWSPSGGLRKVDSGEGFAAFDEPGYAKTAFDFRLEDGVLSTETRIMGTDARASRLFGLYWLAIRPGSGLIRREWLRAIDRRAQSNARAAASASSQSA